MRAPIASCRRLFVFAYALFVVWTTFKYSVLEYDYYKGLADKQQTVTVKNPVSRGTIYSNNDPIGVFATSTDLPDLAVDPKAPGSKIRLYPFLTDATYLDLCQHGTDDKCLEAVAASPNRRSLPKRCSLPKTPKRPSEPN